MIRFTNETKLLYEIAEKERKKLEKEYNVKTFPISYFGCYACIQNYENLKSQDDIKILSFFPLKTNDYDFYLHYAENDFIKNICNEGYKTVYLIDERKYKLFFDKVLVKEYIAPSEAYEKEIEYNGTKYTVQIFVGSVGFVNINELFTEKELEDETLRYLINLATTIQPGAITEERFKEVLPPYYILRKEFGDCIIKEFEKIYRKCCNNVIENIKCLYLEEDKDFLPNKMIMSREKKIKKIKKEKNFLKYTLKGYFLNKTRSDKSKEVIEEFFKVVVESLDDILMFK